MFEETARQWVREMLQGGKFSGYDEEFLKQLIKDYARQLEEIFTCEVKKNLEKTGKVGEFERMLLYDSQYINKYLNQTILGYPGFRINVFDRARKIILGS
jgi:hypothetical protein